jgi:hypothetical protein
VARTVPWVTVCPAFTLTPVTWPETPKFRSAVVVGANVPEVATVWRIVPIDTVTWRCVDVGVAGCCPER